MGVQYGDIVMSRAQHSCDVRIVEKADETGILLVNGNNNKYYEPFEFDLFQRDYELILKKEERLDLIL